MLVAPDPYCVGISGSEEDKEGEDMELELDTEE